MGFQELRQKIADKLREKNAEYKEAQAISEARNDWETTDNSLRNERRQVQKYRDKDEKEQLQAYIRARQAQEDKSWLNPYGILDNQEINISRNHVNIFEAQPNPHEIRRPVNTGNILNIPNAFKSTTKTGGNTMAMRTGKPKKRSHKRKKK